MSSWIKNKFNRFSERRSTASIPVGEPRTPEQIVLEMRACLRLTGGVMATRRRIAALVEMFDGLDTKGRQGFADALNRLDEAHHSSGDQYARLEETELFGRASSKLAILETLEPPRRRMLSLLHGAKGGPALMQTLRQVADDDLSAEIDRVVSD